MCASFGSKIQEKKLPLQNFKDIFLNWTLSHVSLNFVNIVKYALW